MSTNQNDTTREPARRVFAAEFSESKHSFKEGNDDRSPNYILLPSGERANRVLIMGTLTNKEDVSEDNQRAEITDPTGTFYVYANQQYQPDAATVLNRLSVPEYVAVVGKAKTFQNEEGDTLININPEHIVAVDEATRHVWVSDTAEQTMERYENLQEAKDNIEDKNYDPYEQYGEDVVEGVPDTVIEALETLSENLENSNLTA